MSVIATQYPKQAEENEKNVMKVKDKKMCTEVSEPKNAEKRSMCFKSFSSETLHAVLAVTSCSDLVGCQINKFRGFFPA